MFAVCSVGVLFCGVQSNNILLQCCAGWQSVTDMSN